MQSLFRSCSSVCLAAAVFFSNSLAQAQVSIAPLVIELEAERGRAQGAITINNNTDQTLRFRVSPEFFTYGDLGFESIDPTPADLTPYLQFSPRELTVAPNVTRRIRLVTLFPPSLPEGEYRAVVFTERLAEVTDGSGNRTTINTRIGSTIYVRQGDLAPALEIAAASWNEAQQQLQVLVNNTGGASARAKVNWTLQQDGTVMATGVLPETGIIAHSQRQFLLPSPPDTPLAAGNYQLFGELEWKEGDESKNQAFAVNLVLPELNPVEN